MGSFDSVPAGFKLVVVGERELLTLGEAGGEIEEVGGEAGSGDDPHDSTQADEPAGATAVSARWLELRALELAIPATPRAPSAIAESTVDATDARIAQLQTRRLSVRDATLIIHRAGLRSALKDRLFTEEGLVEAQVHFDDGGARLVGRFALAGREAPFTIRVNMDAPVDGQRRVRLDFSDVSLDGPLPVPGPSVGVAVARAIAGVATRAGVEAQAQGAAIEVDALQATLELALVAQGWRLPDLRGVKLRAVTRARAAIRVRFTAAESPVASDARDGGEDSAFMPAPAETLSLLADQAFQAKDWERARRYYAELDRAPDAADVISRDVLVLRRAILARVTGDADEAERCYREMAILTPRHIETRQALAQLALERHDLPEAAARLEEVLSLLPRDSIAVLTDVREHLAEIYIGLRDWPVARHYLELVLAHDPGRVHILERLIGVYDQLDVQSALVEALERLARSSVPTRQRAEALWRQGEVLRDRMHDEGRAFDAYLKSSDLDPGFHPTALRLIDGFWERGQLADVAAVADDLLRVGALPEMEASLRLRVAVALAVRGDGAERAVAAARLTRAPWDEDLARATLDQAFGHLADGPPSAREAAAQVMTAWQNLTLAPTAIDAGVSDAGG